MLHIHTLVQESLMKRIITHWKAGLLALATVASLGFGTAQAFAAPREPAAEAACTNTYCRTICGSLGGNWVPSAGRCYCCG